MQNRGQRARLSAFCRFRTLFVRNRYSLLPSKKSDKNTGYSHQAQLNEEKITMFVYASPIARTNACARTYARANTCTYDFEDMFAYARTHARFYLFIFNKRVLSVGIKSVKTPMKRMDYFLVKVQNIQETLL